MLHPDLWLGHQLGRQVDVATSSGFAALDAELPGHGWPSRGLTEILLSRPGVGELRLLAPALAAAQPDHVVMLFDPPLNLNTRALGQLGVDLKHLLVITTRSQTTTRDRDSLWALEQALKSGHVGAILAWLPPRLHPEKVRRLQLAAHNHAGVAFTVRDASVRDSPSAAPLRLEIAAGGADQIQVRVLKRRGPPLLEPIAFELPSVLSAAARRRSIHGRSTSVGDRVSVSLPQ
jgi:protein ImuA